MTSRTGHELIQDFLATHEIPFVFGNPGTTETTFLAAVAASKATYVLSLHESSAVGIAAGHALITGKPSVVNLHTYSGLANGMCNMRNALMSGCPCPSSSLMPGCGFYTLTPQRMRSSPLVARD